MLRALLVLGLVLLTAWGGGEGRGSDQYEAVVLADNKEAEARRLGVPSPCAEPTQCGFLRFEPPDPPVCPCPTFAPYSLVSPTAAAASAAAAQQNQLASAAQALGTRRVPATPCRCMTYPPPATCVANTCGM